MVHLSERPIPEQNEIAFLVLLLLWFIFASCHRHIYRAEKDTFREYEYHYQPFPKLHYVGNLYRGPGEGYDVLVYTVNQLSCTSTSKSYW